MLRAYTIAFLGFLSHAIVEFQKVPKVDHNSNDLISKYAFGTVEQQ